MMPFLIQRIDELEKERQMVLLECCPPFQWKPSLNCKAMAGGWRFMWAWFAIGYVPFDFNSYVEGLARAGIELHHKGEL